MKFSHCCWWDGPEASNNVSTVDWAINLAVILCIVKVEHAGSFLTPYFETIYQTFFIYFVCFHHIWMVFYVPVATEVKVMPLPVLLRSYTGLLT